MASHVLAVSFCVNGVCHEGGVQGCMSSQDLKAVSKQGLDQRQGLSSTGRFCLAKQNNPIHPISLVYLSEASIIVGDVVYIA